MRRSEVVLLVMIIALGVAVIVLALQQSKHVPDCQGFASSVGPVTVRNGKVVGNSRPTYTAVPDPCVIRGKLPIG
jgi:hypothetical protein